MATVIVGERQEGEGEKDESERNRIRKRLSVQTGNICTDMHTERKALNMLAREKQVNTSCTSGLNTYQLNNA
jgi:hypothetical protein